ncbi:shikimate dehydrogenase [Ammoniphilus oxalaticus]|uniref:Shikimate dehydrogenase (NADP(+)) n=1 Tax=Ammoniphilus oxalaticus TaxID=66863 RepID=A0A419SIV5_9BACL|nr:shikimate dehydrogenase [Ammoniphilus oxalaticus]RKD23964.1 shikimate dehydrogenase [Ammoniphilus oxalaticus]
MNNQTVLTGLFGNPVSQSMSPNMHNAAFQQLGLNFAYMAFAVEHAQLGAAVEAIRALSIRGVNVTIPHKVAVMKFLDEIDAEALDIGAVNTIVNDGGKLIGYNTDGRGYVHSLLEETRVTLSDKRILLVGAGGAARAVGVSLAREGVKQITIANRSIERAVELADDLSRHVQSEPVGLGDVQDLRQVDIVINTSSVGMYPNMGETPLPTDLLHADLLVSDLIYNPLYTELLNQARGIGAKVHNGLGMFVHQGALAFELWTENEAPLELMRKTVEQQLGR